MVNVIDLFGGSKYLVQQLECTRSVVLGKLPISERFSWSRIERRHRKLFCVIVQNFLQELLTACSSWHKTTVCKNTEIGFH